MSESRGDVNVIPSIAAGNRSNSINSTPCKQPISSLNSSFASVRVETSHGLLGRATTQTTMPPLGGAERSLSALSSDKRGAKSETDCQLPLSLMHATHSDHLRAQCSEVIPDIPWQSSPNRVVLLLLWATFILLLGACIGAVSVCFHWTVHLLAHFMHPDVCSNYPKEAEGTSVCHDRYNSTSLGIYIMVRSITVILVAEATCYWSTVYMPEIHGGGILPVKVCLAVGASVPFRVGVNRFIISALYLGFGNPLGAETPTLHYACAVACTLYWLANMIVGSTYFPEINRTSMVLVGCVCGMAAAFNSVLAGMVYYIEHFSHTGCMQQRLLGFYTMFACLMSCIVSRVMWDNVTPQYSNGVDAAVKLDPTIVKMGNKLKYEELAFLYLVVLAIGAGFVFGLISHAFLLCTSKLRLFLTVHVKQEHHGLISGVVTSILASLCFFLTRFDGVWGVGWESLSTILTNTNSVEARFTFVCAKFLVCCLAVACGGNGGIFGPALVIGGAAGSVLAGAFPPGSVTSKILPVLGMCGVFSGIHRLPLTSIVICYEFVELGATSDNLIFLMLGVSFVAELTASELSELDIFGVMMVQDGVNPDSLAGGRVSTSCDDNSSVDNSVSRRSLMTLTKDGRDGVFGRRASTLAHIQARNSATSRHVDLLRCVATRTATQGDRTDSNRNLFNSPSVFSSVGRRGTLRDSQFFEVDENLVRLGIMLPSALDRDSTHTTSASIQNKVVREQSATKSNEGDATPRSDENEDTNATSDNSQHRGITLSSPQCIRENE